MSFEKDILRTRKGLIEAPAGCGKTHLIVKCVSLEVEGVILILTHTTAGIESIRKKLVKKNISNKKYKLATIDGWAKNIISKFPERAGYLQEYMSSDSPDYKAIEKAATRLCSSGHIDELLEATYSRAFVDEYQDCTDVQHSLIVALAKVIPIVIFGDPLQAIFNFSSNTLPNWENDVVSIFPRIGFLNTPWRWNNVGSNELGKWLLNVRQDLLLGKSIDLRTGPSNLIWYQLKGGFSNDLLVQQKAKLNIISSYPNDSLLIIGDSINEKARYNYAKRTHDINAIETVELKDIIFYAHEISNKKGEELLDSVMNFLSSVMNNVKKSDVKKRVNSISNKRNTTLALPYEIAAVRLRDQGDYNSMLDFILKISSDSKKRIYRKIPYQIMIEALQQATTDTNALLPDLVLSLRERYRYGGRSLPKKAIGSTLLIKGLEFDHVIILDANGPTMNAQNLYVALTRGSKSITVLSRTHFLNS